jgi:hypothetical protein
LYRHDSSAGWVTIVSGVLARAASVKQMITQIGKAILFIIQSLTFGWFLIGVGTNR